MLNPFVIMKEVEEYFHLKSGSLVTRNRSKTTADARAIAMYLLRVLNNLSFIEIGDYFDRDHSTVIHNCKKIVNIVHNHKNRWIEDCIIVLIAKIQRKENE